MDRPVDHDSVVKDNRIEGAVDYAEDMEIIDRITADIAPRYSRQSVRRIRMAAWTAGYEHALETVDKGELLEEATALHYQMFDLTVEQKNLLALTEFADEVRMELINHKDECDCYLCKALAVLNQKCIITEVE